MAAMTYLQLAQKLREKCRISGTGPSAVTGQSGEMLRVVNWINEAWTDIQEARSGWLWMQGEVSFTTTSQQATYTPAQCGITDLASWDWLDSWRVYATATGTPSEQFLSPIDYASWRDLYQFSSLRTSYGWPTHITETPNKSLGLGLVPDATGYAVVGKYWKAPTSLVANTDTPGLPERFHMLLVYRAMMYYGSAEVAPETYQEGALEFARMMRNLERDQLPAIRLGGTVA